MKEKPKISYCALCLIAPHFLLVIKSNLGLGLLKVNFIKIAISKDRKDIILTRAIDQKTIAVE